MNYLFADSKDPGDDHWPKDAAVRFLFVLPMLALTFALVVPLFVWYLFDQKRALRATSRLGFYRRRLFRKLSR